MTSALALAIDLLAVLGMLGLFMSVNKLFGPKGAHEGDGLLPYETGMPPIERAQDNMAVLYYRFAVLFVVFDVDLAFVLPWALTRSGFGLQEAVSVTVFIFLMLLMLAYFWRRGVLECEIF